MSDIVKQLRGKEPFTCNANFQEALACDEGDCKCEHRLQQGAADEIERLREALLDCHHVLHKLMGIVPGNDTAVDEMAKAMAKARSALGEGE